MKVLAALLACLPLAAAGPAMTAAERTKTLNWLEESRKEFLAAISGLTDAQWKWKPTPERWSNTGDPIAPLASRTADVIVPNRISYLP